MNMQEYIDLKHKYDYTLVNEHTGERIAFDGWDALQRHLAFLEYDAALEEYVENEKENWQRNDGQSLMDVSTTDVECILDEYIARTEDVFYRIGTEEMRNSIEAVTGLVC